ncbi:glycosyltransferase family 8 protein [Lactarius akahatsu]|uniref:Glycosyltransferase family 8 protein n=1 Tax=Lactarius akahatsu TaxID=416441 RepID=A0AAD4L6W8_9AGAM|nr:glycosyltransferase family 8 protein [Lactarius akahatsu]
MVSLPLAWNVLTLPYSRVSSRKRDSKDAWLLRGLALATFFNLVLLYKLYHPQTPTPLDDFQMLKPQFTSWIPISNASHPDSRAVVTAVYNDLYTIPAATLGYSLRKAGTSARLILFHLPGRLSARALCILRAAGWEPLEVELIPAPHGGAGIDHRFGDTYTKLRLWTLDTLGIQRVVYLDADTLVRRNFDELFDLPFPFAAVPDVYGDSGFKLHFNTGVLVLHPSSAAFETMRAQIANARFNPREADQAFLNVYFGADAVRLPYVYNGNLAIRERSPALWDALRDELRIVHYTLPKPYPKEGKEIVEGAHLERAIERARKDRGGVHVEAIEWWFTAYKEFRMQNRVALRQCDV